MLHPALEAAEQIDATVANMRFVKPLDIDLVEWLARAHDGLVTVEENVIAGGAGSAVAEALAERGIALPILHLGLPDNFIEHGDPGVLLQRCGLDATGIAAAIAGRFGPQAVPVPRSWPRRRLQSLRRERTGCNAHPPMNRPETPAIPDVQSHPDVTPTRDRSWLASRFALPDPVRRRR